MDLSGLLKNLVSTVARTRASPDMMNNKIPLPVLVDLAGTFSANEEAWDVLGKILDDCEVKERLTVLDIIETASVTPTTKIKSFDFLYRHANDLHFGFRHYILHVLIRLAKLYPDTINKEFFGPYLWARINDRHKAVRKMVWVLVSDKPDARWGKDVGMLLRFLQAIDNEIGLHPVPIEGQISSWSGSSTAVTWTRSGSGGTPHRSHCLDDLLEHTTPYEIYAIQYHEILDDPDAAAEKFRHHLVTVSFSVGRNVSVSGSG